MEVLLMAVGSLCSPTSNLYEMKTGSSCQMAAHWDEPMETRVLMSIIIGQDTYRSGEIHHIRALLQ